MKSTELYRMVVPPLGEALCACGFEVAKRPARTWYEEGPDCFRVIRVGVNRWGYIRPIGGRFFLDAWCGTELASAPELPGQEIELPALLPDHALRRMKRMNDAIMRRVMKWTAGDAIEEVVLTDWIPYARARLRIPHDSRTQTEMSYVDAEDVRGWVEFLLGYMPDIVRAVRRAKQKKPGRGRALQRRGEAGLE